MYPGAHVALEETGVLKNIQHVAGSSVGSLTAGLLAVGISTHAFRDAFIDLDFKTLLGESIGFGAKHDHPGSLFFSKTGLPLENWTRKLLLTSVNQFLHATDVSNDAPLHALQTRLNKGCDAAFTFADLHLLHQRFPQQFKQLTMTAIRYPDGKLTVFDVNHYPHLDIAKAIRASSSLPVFLKPLQIGDDYFMDGGYLDNIPTNYFDTDQTGEFVPNISPQQTVVFAFGEGIKNERNPVFQALYGSRKAEFKPGETPKLYRPNVVERFKRNHLLCWLVGLRPSFASTQKREEAYLRLWSDYPLRTVELRVGKLKSTDYRDARCHARVMCSMGYLDTLNFIMNHQLHDSSRFNQHHVLSCLLVNFMQIYQDVLTASQKETHDNPLIQKLNLSLSAGDMKQAQVLFHIKQQVEFKLDSIEAFALSRSIERHQGCLNETKHLVEIESIAAEMMQGSRRYRFLHQPAPVDAADPCLLKLKP